MYAKIFGDDGKYLELEVDRPKPVLFDKDHTELAFNATNPNFSEDIHLNLTWSEVSELALLLMSLEREMLQLTIGGHKRWHNKTR